MNVTNQQVAHVFEQLADLMEIRGDNGFRVRAFRRAAQAVENLSEEAASMLASKALKDIPGIGAGAIKRIGEILETGTCADLTQLKQELPPGLLDMLNVSGLGPKKVKLFYYELSIDSVDALEAAARAGALS